MSILENAELVESRKIDQLVPIFVATKRLFTNLANGTTKKHPSSLMKLTKLLETVILEDTLAIHATEESSIPSEQLAVEIRTVSGDRIMMKKVNKSPFPTYHI